MAADLVLLLARLRLAHLPQMTPCFVQYRHLVNVSALVVAHARARPSMSDDLFERYNLTGLAAEVARILPNGEKNAIRKTYKGHIKKLGVHGHWDSVKEDWERPDSLLNLAKMPEEEWKVHFVQNKDVNQGFTSEVSAKLMRACVMSKGTVPRNCWDSSVLGDLAPGKGDRQSSSARPTAPNTPNPMVPGPGLNRPKAQTPVSAQEAARPKRNIKKRGYGDSSFEGYGEGYADDDGGAETGYSTGEGDMASNQKRRKKVHMDALSMMSAQLLT